MSRKSKQHDKQSKLDAIQYVKEHPDLTQAECCKNLGIGLSTLSRWQQQYKDNEGDVPTRGSGNYATDEQKEIAHLKRELRDTLDGIVEKAIHQLFDRVKTIPEDEMIQSQMKKQEADCKAQLTRAKVLCNRREKELSDYQSEVLKVIRGESQLSPAIINELVEKAEDALKNAKKDEAHWTEELGGIRQKAAELHKLYGKVVSWSELFDTCNMAEKKMIVFQLIRQVRVWKDYRVEIDFNVNIEQLLSYRRPQLSA